ncbi:hypothetical protein M758_5G032900 [Ceratodon purpureus]|uniref:Secreted protein n=1 Tax=Ceratodon purpureus TaxID=3225 RepID=A0A8T0HY40_CERPU|nr:hypothetical protein KC19_5G031000 [Ceratodon purpureus]KAG0615335.1 hypothetical protein M758_5G032900 [Ceratodon purpureus]
MITSSKPKIFLLLQLSSLCGVAQCACCGTVLNLITLVMFTKTCTIPLYGNTITGLPHGKQKK